MSNIIILGPPGSGKGTQAKKLAEKLGYFYFGTGDLIREEIAQKTDLGQQFESFAAKGQLVPDAAIGELVKNKIRGFKDGAIVFDGFPRSIEQARILETILPNEKFTVLNIKVSPESLMKRMLKRRICSKCGKIYIIEKDDGQICDVCDSKLIQRPDDNPEVLSSRIKVYEKQTAPLVDYYQRNGRLVNIDGEPSIERVEKVIWENINVGN